MGKGMQMKLFISMPMAGMSSIEIKSAMERCAKGFRETFKVDAELIDSVLAPTSRSPVECLAESLKLMSEADLVLFCCGWDKSRGCRIEHDVALAYGFPIYILGE
jgi:hypothetical protein